MKNTIFFDNLRKDLKMLIKLLGLKQFQVAKYTGVSQAVLSLFLAGKRGLSVYSYQKLVEFINKSSFHDIKNAGNKDEN